MRNDWRQTPATTRVALADPHRDEIIARHAVSLDAGVPTYVDPVSGFSVFTADFLAGRGYCCESGCRHCPYTG